MPKKPNYNFERRERDRAKAAKKAEKLAAKAEAKEVSRAGVDSIPAKSESRSAS